MHAITNTKQSYMTLDGFKRGECMKLTNKLIHDITKILLHYGTKHQKGKAREELCELENAIFEESLLNCSHDHVKEEIADVYVMLEQLKKIYHFTDMEIKEVMEFKVKRQLERMEKE